MRSQRVFRELGISLFGDEFALHPGVGILLKTLVFLGPDAFIRQVTRLYLAHLGFNLREVIYRERIGALEVIVEPRLSRRTHAQLRLRIQFQHRRCQQMRGRVPVDVQRLWIL